MLSAVSSSLWDIPTTCQRSDSMSCAAVWNWTHNEYLAHAAAWVIGKPLSILVLVAFAWVLRWLTHRIINRFIVKAAAGTLTFRWPSVGQAPSTAQQTTRRKQRAEALGSLLRSIASVLIYGVVFVMVLSQLGMDIAPILASASVVGLAIGFGAQSLVKDFLSGIAMMVEDQYGVGDSIKIADVSGTVEAVGLRVTRFRDVDGTVWYVRNGEIMRVGNQSQNWARTVVDITVGYETDIAHAQEVLRGVVHGMWEDPDYRPVILEEPEVWGVQSMGPQGLVVRVSMKTAPLQQWRLARVLRERIKDAFDEANIRMFTTPPTIPQ
jgi:small conductance mechanosensitive channel